MDISHCAATPTGMIVMAHVELVEIDRSRLRFRVECHDDVELIGRGYHERFVIALETFLSRSKEKALRKRT